MSQGTRFQQQLQAAAQECVTTRDIAPAIAATTKDNARLAPRPVGRLRWRLARF
jgi:hypothetical protein